MKDTLTIRDILPTSTELEQAIALYQDASPGTFARRCEQELIAPRLAAIEARLGQKMNARYLAYVVEYVLGAARRGGQVS